MVEIRQPGGAEFGAVSTRSVNGHAHGQPGEPYVAITLPRSTEMISCHEVFAAAEATTLFEAFFHTSRLRDGYTLRPVEGYTPDGGHRYPALAPTCPHQDPAFPESMRRRS